MYFDHVLVWSFLFVFRESVSVPVFSNGNIQFLRDVDQCLEETKCDGIMIAGKTLDIRIMYWIVCTDNVMIM